MEDTNPFKEEEEIKQDIPVDDSHSKAEEELSALAITTEKYKPIVINGVSIPSVVRTDAPDKPYIVTEPRTVADLSKDEVDWLNTNINFILDATGEFISVTSGNQLIDNENYDSAYEPQFHICVDSNMSAEVESRDHAIKMFNRYTYNLFKGAVKLIDYKVPRGSSLAIAKCSARLIFDTVEDFEAWIKDSVIPATEAPTNNHILSFFPKLNPLYLNSKVRTLDTFSFYANPKAWIAQNEAGNTYKAKFNILMFPEFIGALTITTYHSAAKTIEVNMEQLSNRLKAIAESHIYKKA